MSVPLHSREYNGSSANIPNRNVALPTSSGQHVLMKDQRAIKSAIRRTMVVLNSRDRNLVAYPNSAKFKVTFRRPLTNVSEVELVSGCIPAFLFNINTEWNKFTFKEYFSSFTVTLTPGFYTNAQLATELQNALNSLPGIVNTYAVSLNPITGVLSIARTAGLMPFGFYFLTGDYRDSVDFETTTVISINTPARLLGFGIDDYLENGGIIVAPTPMDLDNFANRVYLHLNYDNNMELKMMERGAGQLDAFEMFLLNPGESDYLILDREKYVIQYKSKPAPISRMSGFEVSFRDEFGRVVDFLGKEVNLTFEITHLE